MRPDHPIRLSISAPRSFLIDRIFSQVLLGRQQGELGSRLSEGRPPTAFRTTLEDREDRDCDSVWPTSNYCSFCIQVSQPDFCYMSSMYFVLWAVLLLLVPFLVIFTVLVYFLCDTRVHFGLFCRGTVAAYDLCVLCFH